MTNTAFYTELLMIDALLDERKRPLCKSDACGFRCMALRPKQIIEGYEEPVHYCGLGEPGQKPLRNGSKAKGIVIANTKCPVHRKAPDA